MPLTPLNVEVSFKPDGGDVYASSVGPYGRVYDLSFKDLINLVAARCGREQKRLEYRK